MPSTQPALPAAASVRHPLERFLSLFSDVRDSEGRRLLLLALNAFLILVANYVKPVREVLILDQPGGAEIKSYAYAAQALLLFAIVPAYGAPAPRPPACRGAD